MNEVTVLLIQFAIKFGLDAAIAIAKALQAGATIEDAIAALEIAKIKTAQTYLDDARALNPVLPKELEIPPADVPPISPP